MQANEALRKFDLDAEIDRCYAEYLRQFVDQTLAQSYVAGETLSEDLEYAEFGA